MAIFRQTFVIDSPVRPVEAWRRLLLLVKTRRPVCPNCGQIPHARDARFCPGCGQPFARTVAPQFEGIVASQEFRIERIISYRNPCIPVINGRFDPLESGTRIVVDMRMHFLGYVLLIGGMGLSFFVPTLIFLGGDKTPSSQLVYLVPIAVPLFIGMLCWIFFTVEANIARATLHRIWTSGPPH